MAGWMGLTGILAADPPPPGGWEALLSGPLPLIIMLGVMAYLMVIRPENRRRAAQQAMLANLKKNDRVVTAGGIYGTVASVNREADEVVLKVDESNNTRLRVRVSSVTVLAGKDDQGSTAGQKPAT